jgi:hypothetical protein
MKKKKPPVTVVVGSRHEVDIKGTENKGRSGASPPHANT